MLNTETGQSFGEAVVGINDGTIHALYWFESHSKGMGTRTMRALVANSTEPITIDNIMNTTKPIWDKIGIYDYDGPNAKPDWRLLQRKSARGVQDGLQARTDPAGPRPSGSIPQKGLKEKGLRAYLASKLGARGVRNLLDSGKFKIASSND